MKNFTLLILSLFLTTLGFSQGVLQEHGIVLSTGNGRHLEKTTPARNLMEEDCGFTTPSNDFETSVGSLRNYKIANDFVVDESMGNFSLEAITFYAFVEPGGEVTEADYFFYEDSEEGPGNIITSLENMTATSVEVVGEYEDDNGVKDVLKVYLELDTPLVFESGEDGTIYWMAVQVPNYTGSSIAFELISEIVTPNETYVFLAGSWRGIGSLFGVVRDGVLTLSGSCDASEACDQVDAGSLEGPSSVCALNEFILTAAGATTGVSGVTYTWESSPLDQENWTVMENANSLVLTMDEGIEERTKFRFTISCESGNSDTTEAFEVGLNPADECYCEPQYTLGCDDGDTINRVSITDSTGEIIFQNDSGCGEGGYTDYTQDLPAPELLHNKTYTITIASDSDLAAQENVRVWMDMNQNGTFEDSEEIANTNGLGLNDQGEFSFQVTIPQEIEVGTYRIRVRLVWLSVDIGPCENKSYGEAEDYAVVITDQLGVENTVFDGLQFYPNPVEDILYLTAKEPIEELTVYNLVGQEILKSVPNAMDFQLRTQSLTGGVYMVEVKINGVQKTFKLIKK